MRTSATLVSPTTASALRSRVSRRGRSFARKLAPADFYSALDVALDKIDNRLRRAADRRRVHRGRRTPVSVAEAMASLVLRTARQAQCSAVRSADENALLDAGCNEPLGAETDDQPWHIVRMKEHPGDPMTVDDALFHMELLGHDFYLFNDKESGRPSVVYRRRAYDYGVISLAAARRSHIVPRHR